MDKPRRDPSRKPHAARRRWLQALGAWLLPHSAWAAGTGDAPGAAGAAGPPPGMSGAAGPAVAPPTASRVRPGQPGWPTDAQWQQLRQSLGPAIPTIPTLPALPPLPPLPPIAATPQDTGAALIALQSPWRDCEAAPAGPACTRLFEAAHNPYALGDNPGLTQTLGWVGAWQSSPSVFAVAARSTADVVAAVNFARLHRLRLVIKGGGHSYQGTSNAADSLLLWTRRMTDITLHEDFVAQGCAGSAAPVRAVSVGAGVMWAQAYDAVTTRGGGYVQGGGCLSVGVAGLVQSGGFGSFSKAYGLASASLLEAELVTADGVVRIANACTHPDLFWALKGGGGGSLGVVTRLTLKVHPLPETFGAVNFTVQAASAAAFRRLIGLTIDFCQASLVGPHWGEQLRFRADNAVGVAMVFQGLDRSQAKAVWQPFLDQLASAPADFNVAFSPLKIVSTSARTFWSPTLVKRLLGFIRQDDRPGAPPGNVFWPGDQGQAGQVLYGYQSTWLPAALLRDDQRPALADALFAATRHWAVSLHLNKGLAGAPAQVLAAARDTAINPAVLDAFALAITANGGPPAYPGVPGHEPDEALARQRAQATAQAMGRLRMLSPGTGAYLAESDYFQPQWQQAFWGSNYPRLLAVKHKYDAEGLFFVHHGVGSERWSADGFTRLG